MVGILEAFVVSFAIDATAFERQADDVQEKSTQTRDVAKKAFDGIEGAARNTAKGVRSISMELLGLFLTFQGASSITGFIGNMVAGTAAAERMGQTIGMTTAKVMAWQAAMREVGGQPGDANSSLQALEGIKQEWQQFGIRGPRAQILQAMGITPQDLEKSDPGQMLTKLAGAPRPWGNERYANQLQQLGLSQNMIYFLMQGGDHVKKQLAQYERNSDKLEEQAKEAQKLQEGLAELNNSISKLLVPVLNKLLPPITRLAEWLDRIINGGGAKEPSKPGTIWEDPLTGGGLFRLRRDGGDGGAQQAAAGAPSPKQGVHADPIMKFMMDKGLTWKQALGIRAGIQAESGGNPNARNPTSGAYGIGQWLGSRKAELFRRYGKRPSMKQQLEFMWHELTGGDPGGKKVLAQKGIAETLRAYITDFMRPQGKNWEHVGDWRADMRRGAGYIKDWSSQQRAMNIGTVNIYTRASDPKAVAREVHNLRGRATVVHTDQRVRP